MKHLLTGMELSHGELEKIFNLAVSLRKSPQPILKGKTLAMIFEKPSTRTRVSFEVAMQQLGGHAIFLSKNDIQIGRGETIADTSRVLSRYCDFIMARVFSHSTLEELSRHSSVPVINGLSDLYHPCQILGDLLTIRDRFGRLMGLKLAYIGDGNNVCNSLLVGCSMTGVHVSVACPKGYEPHDNAIKYAKDHARATGARIEITHDAEEAARGANVIYTDTWVSMGDEAQREAREKALKEYQVDSSLAKHATKDWAFMHCLPAHRGHEVADEIMDGPHSAVWDQAENRLHIQKAILAFLDRKA